MTFNDVPPIQLTPPQNRVFEPLTAAGRDVCACKSTLAQGTRVGGLEGGLVVRERLLVFGQLAGQHDSRKPL